MARRAYALQTLLAQVDALYPNRSKASDGWIGDAAHATRVSDHNPDANGVVRAQDFTHDPDDLSGEWLANALIKSGDKRIKYIIWNKRIWQNGSWKAYDGLNPHTKHLHLSVGGDYDNKAKWNLGVAMHDGKTAQEWYLIANDWHVRADDRQKLLDAREEEVIELKKQLAACQTTATVLKPGKYEVK